MKNLIITTKTKVEVLNILLQKYDIEVSKYAYEYKQMQFKDDEEFKDTFYEVMKFLAEKRIFVTVFDIMVQVGSNPKTARYERFNNYKHSSASRVDFFK